MQSDFSTNRASNEKFLKHFTRQSVINHNMENSLAICLQHLHRKDRAARKQPREKNWAKLYIGFVNEGVLMKASWKMKGRKSGARSDTRRCYGKKSSETFIIGKYFMCQETLQVGDFLLARC